jgi:hypothetical protein
MREATGPINIPSLHRVSKFTFFAVLFASLFGFFFFLLVLGSF